MLLEFKNHIKKNFKLGEVEVTLETGEIARQASSVIVKMGDTVVLTAVTISKSAKQGIDFFPLTVNYIEKFYAVGKFPGGFIKRETKPSDREVLTARLIDRHIRPLFPEGFYNEVQVVCTTLSYDGIHSPDIAAMIGTSAALSISEAPFAGPTSAVRVGYIEGKYVLNPSKEELTNSELDLTVAGTADSIMMVESEAKELSEKVMLEALKFGHKQMQPVIQAVNELQKEAGKEKMVVESVDLSVLHEAISSEYKDKLIEIYKNLDKTARREGLDALREEILAKFVAAEDADENYDENQINSIIKKIEKEIVRGGLLGTGMRLDGRKDADIRPICCKTGVLPSNVHGSSLFTRGETQALGTITLGTSFDEQIVDDIEGADNLRFMLHYNFPPYSVGEVGMLRAPGRREIGHGKLAYRSIQPVIPAAEKFPYTIRAVSEIMESNGSSSMATVCATSLALMAAGVPIKSHVAGIAMGLVKEEENFVVLSDIMGDEDHLGDMDFKVAGTREGINALQMDIKIKGITLEIMETALNQARGGIDHILKIMEGAINDISESLSEHAPKIHTMQISTDKIRDVIGSGGKVIKEICEVSDAKVNIEDDGTVCIAAKNAEGMDKALEMIKDIVEDPIVGEIYKGDIIKLFEFGAIVKFRGSREGMVHISELSEDRVNNIHEHVKIGDVVYVELQRMGNDGKVSLSMRKVDQVSGEKKKISYEDAVNEKAKETKGKKSDKITKKADEQAAVKRNDNSSNNNNGRDRKKGDARAKRQENQGNDPQQPARKKILF